MKKIEPNSIEAVILFILYICMQDEKVSDEEIKELLVTAPILNKMYLDIFGEFIALDLEERERLVADLGTENHTLILRNHGVLTAGEDVPTAFQRLYSFEQAAGIQLRVMAASGASGVPIRKPSHNVVRHTREQFEGGEARAGATSAIPSWPGYLRLLDNLDPSWRQ